MNASLLAVLLAAPCGAAIERVPALEAPLAPTPAVAQLRLDLASANVALSPTAPLSAVIAAIPAAKPVETEAIARLQVARQILSHYDPARFEKLPPADQEKALSALWDGWSAKGLVPSALDTLILEGVRDRSLTSANKSVFLGVAVLGYPMEDAQWLARTRIGDALEENTLTYPAHLRWKTADHTPEFLGTTKEAQSLVDHWSAAADYAAAVVRQVRAGSSDLPKSRVVAPAAAAALARVIKELKDARDTEALDYLEQGRDPTFAAFLLDARKPGYYLYNGEGSVVSRILGAKAAAGLGVRRLEQKESGVVVPSTYFYRPHRVVERLREIPELAGYASRAPSVAAPKGDVSGFDFVDADFLAGSALESKRNVLSSYGEKAKASLGRYDLPLPAHLVRDRMDTRDPHPSLGAGRFAALSKVLRRSTAFWRASDDVEIRIVSERWQTRDKLVAKTPRGVMIQLFALEELERSRDKDFARFMSAAVDGALQK